MRGAYSPELVINFKNSVCFVNDSITVNATQPTPVTLAASLATLAILLSHESMKEFKTGRERFVRSVGNVHGYVRGKDAKFPMLRKNLGFAVAELDKTYLFGEQSKELALTQQDEVNSVFPSPLVLLDSTAGQTVIDPIFHFPKLVEASCMSVPAFNRFRRITHHLRVPEKETCRNQAVWIPMPSFRTITSLRKMQGRWSLYLWCQQIDQLIASIGDIRKCHVIA